MLSSAAPFLGPPGACRPLLARDEGLVRQALLDGFARLGLLAEPATWAPLLLPRVRGEDGADGSARAAFLEALGALLEGLEHRGDSVPDQDLEDLVAALATPDFALSRDPRLRDAGARAANRLGAIARGRRCEGASREMARDVWGLELQI